jgi:hypothetical protein
MTIETVCKELELLLSDIAFAGLHNLQPITLQKLEDLKKWMIELNMQEGVKLADRFIHSAQTYQTGETSITVLVSDLCTLEFYEKTITNNLHS